MAYFKEPQRPSLLDPEMMESLERRDEQQLIAFLLQNQEEERRQYVKDIKDFGIIRKE